MTSAVEGWLPHRPPFRFVDRVVSRAEASAEMAIDLGPTDARLTNGVLPPLMLLESLAQTIAAFSGMQAGGAEPGMLVEIDRARLLRAAPAGASVRLVVERRHALGNMSRFGARAELAGELLVEAELTVARVEPPAPGAAAVRERS